MNEKSVASLQQEILELKKENQGLKETLSKMLVQPQTKALVPYTGQAPKNYDSPEEKILDEQITVLETFSSQRALSLEEIKALDLLIKNKNAILSKKPVEPDWRDVSEKTSEAELLRLAGDVAIEPIRSKKSTSKKNPVE